MRAAERYLARKRKLSLVDISRYIMRLVDGCKTTDQLNTCMVLVHKYLIGSSFYPMVCEYINRKRLEVQYE